jgi:type IV pilus assembly protein PilA
LVVRPSAFALVHKVALDEPALQADLSRHFLRTLGIDLPRLEEAVAYAIELGPPQAAVWLRIPDARPSPRWTPAGSADGVALYQMASELVAAVVPDGLLCGQRAAVEAGLAVARGRAPAVGPTSALSRPEARAADIVLAVDVAGIPDPQLAQAAGMFGVRDGVVTLTGTEIVLALHGEPGGMARLLQVVRAGLAMVTSQLSSARDASLGKDDVFEGMGAIIAYHRLRALVSELQLDVSGDTFRARTRLPQLEGATPAVAVVGVGAAVAIPAFMKYIRRSKAAEAPAQLGALRAGVEAFYAQHRSAGRRFRFPASTGWTPPAGCCASPGGRCPGDAHAFDAPTWRALGFAPADPHYYQYRFTSTGTGKSARFTAEARGDLDCNGTYSDYRVEGFIDARGQLQVREHRTNELE